MAIYSLKSKEILGTLTAPANIDLGGMIPIATVTSNNTSATITFSSIPQNYEHLQIRIYGGNGNDPVMQMQFNSDTGSNYSYHRISGTGTGTLVSATASSSNITIAGYSGLNFTTNASSISIIDILDYSNSNKNKTTRALSGWDNNSNGYLDFESGCWYSTNAITSISLKVASGNWATNSNVALYGIKRAGA